MVKNILITTILIIGLAVTYCFSGAVPEKPARNVGMITDEHAKIHLGQIYTAGFIDIAVADDDYVVMLIDITTNTFTNDEVHLVFNANTGGDSVIKLFEGAGCTSSGTVVTSYNHNRDVADSPEAIIYQTPTVIVTSGTAIYSALIPAGTNNNASGSMTGRSSEWVLEDASYLLEFQNISGSAKPMSIELFFYEKE